VRPGGRLAWWRQLRAVARKEFRQTLRDRQVVGILLFVPVFILLLYGYALNFDIRHVPLAVEDRDRSPASRHLIAAFTHSEYFDLVATVTARGEIERLLDTGAARAVLVVPQGFARDLATDRSPAVQLLVGGDNANTATAVLGYAQAIVRAVATDFGRGRREPRVIAEPRVWYNPELRTTLFLVPGLIAFIAMITAVISTSLSLVGEKERGTLEQMRLAPVGATAFVLGKSLPYLGLSLTSALLIVAAAMGLFDLPQRGSWALLLATTTLFLVGALGFGVLLSTIAHTQQVAFQLALLSSFLPTFVLSGFVFPIASMPAAIQVVTYAVPARYYLAALRAIVLKGADLTTVRTDLAALALFAAIVLGLAVRRLAQQWR
jgi:ABC-2 type transport system permease protein